MKKQNVLKRATIRNARLCESAENLGHLTSFDIERDRKGWDFVENASICGASGGFLFLSALTESPSISRSTKLSGMDAGLYTEVVLKFKYVRNRSDSVASKGKLQFTTNSDLVFDDDKSLEFDVNSDGDWHIYYLNMGPVSTWVGYINNLKITFATDGRKDDEIFLSYIKIQQPSFNFCSDSCYEDTSTTILAEDFDNEVIGAVPSDLSTSNTATNRHIETVQDPDSLTNTVLSFTNSTASGTGPTGTFLLNSTVNTGTFSCRLYPTKNEGKIRLQKDTFLSQDCIELKISTSGTLQYKLGASTYLEMEGSPKVTLNQWNDLLITFDGSAVLFDVTLNGQVGGTQLPYVYKGEVAAVQIEHTGTTSGSFYVDDIILVAQENLSTACPGMGKQGIISAQPLQQTVFNIVKDVNDTIIVNINDFGDVVLKIPAAIGMTPIEMREALERQIASIDVGGYPYAEVTYLDNVFSIKSGTYGFDSNVIVKKHEESTLSDELGFTVDGVSVSSSTVGRPHTNGFTFSNSFRAKTLNLQDLKGEESGQFKLMHDPDDQVVEIGAKQAGTTSRKNVINGQGKTLIDYYHRATQEGEVTQVFFHGLLPTSPEVKVTGSSGQLSGKLFDTGIFDLPKYGVTDGDVLVIETSGYAGNGEYSITVDGRTGIVRLKNSISLPPGKNLTFHIHNIPKVKHIRPKMDGSYVVINEAEIGISTSGQLYTRTPDTHRVSVSWNVHRGDLIGIYNAIGIFAGNDPNGLPDSLYLDYEGDASDSFTATELKGQGIKGIGLYGNNPEKQKRAVYDIELDATQSLEYIEIEGRQKTKDLEYNLTAAINNGFSLSPTITGTHVHIVEDNNANKLRITHTNVGYNTQVLTDGLTFASNGLLGTFETSVSGSSYFYISGDGEFAGYEFDAEGNLVKNSLEFPITQDGNGGFSGLLHLYITDYIDDQFDFLMSWNAKKTVHKFKVYFKEYPNVDGFVLEWKKSETEIFDGTKPGFEKIGRGNTSEFTEVVLDKMVLVPEELEETDVYQRHFDPTFIGYASLDNSDDGAVLQGLRKNPYTVLEKTFDPVTTTAINWKILWHKSTKMSEIELYSKTSSSIELDSIAELYFSIDGDTFQRADLEFTEEGKLRYTIGVPTKYLRLIVEPTSIVELDKITAVSSDDLIRYKDENQTAISSVDVDVEKGMFSNPVKVSIKNGTGVEADVEVMVDTNELFDDVLLKTSLNTLEDVLEPEIGPVGFLLQDEGFDLPTTENVAINADCYGLKNLAEDKPVFVCDNFSDESDFFPSNVDLLKWEKRYNNFPQGTISDAIYEGSPPGLMMRSKTGGTSSGPNPSCDQTLVSKWLVTGAFSASVAAIHDSRGSNAGQMGAVLGIVDVNGRFIVITKSRSRFTGSFTGGRNWNDYFIIDSAGTPSTTLASVRTYCGSGFCGTQTGSDDDYVEYVLTATRIIKDSTDVLRFSYIDNTNGTGSNQWSTSDYFEINLKTLATPLVGPIKIMIGNRWTNSGLFATGSPTAEGYAFTRINRFSFGGSSNYSRSYSFVPDDPVSTSGYLHIDNKSITLNSTTGAKYVALDLGKRYAIDILDVFTKTVSGVSLWNSLNTQFSNSDTSNPSQVVWESDRSDARWIMFSERSVAYTATSGIKYLDYVRVYPDITRLAEQQTTNSEWTYLGNVLTDGDRNTVISQLDYPVIAVKLENQFDIENFRLLDKNGYEEARSGQTGYNGWQGAADFTVSSHITDDPKEVIWGDWLFYNSANKPIEPLKWFAFRNKTFDTLGMGSAAYAASFTASTKGDSSSDIGQVNDRVDFTEYSKWFTVNYKFDQDLALLGEDAYDKEGSLFGTSKKFARNGVSPSEGYFVFDGNDRTQLILQGLPAKVWRVFGNETSTVTTSGVTISGNGGVIITSGTGTVTTSITLSGVAVDGFRIYVPSGSPGIPNTISIQNLTGTDPTSDSSWTTLYTESSLATAVQVDDSTQYLFNNGDDLVVYLPSRIVSSGIRLLVTAAQFSTIDNALGIGSFSILQTSTQDNDQPAVVLDNDPAVRVGGRQSLKATYQEGFSNSVKITAGGTFNLVPDEKWSIQDFLTFYMRVDNPESIDWSNSKLRLGKDKQYFYQWSLASLQSQINSLELTKQSLRFLDAESKATGTIDPVNPDRTALESKVDFINGPIGFFELEIKPSGTASSDINIWLDNFDIVRENFSLQGINKTLYLNNSELIYYPVTDFDIRRGFFEAVITPDWDGTAIRTQLEDEAFTIFTAVNSLDESLSCFYDARYGLMIVTSTAEVKTSFPVGKFDIIEKYKPFKLSLVWDSEGTSIDAKANSNLRIWLNDLLVGDFVLDFPIQNTKSNYFFIGSRAYQSDVAINAKDVYPSKVAMKLMPKTNSLTGGIENVLLSRAPKKLSYSDVKYLRDKIFISIDGVNYYNGADPALPFILYNIPAGDSVDVWVTTNLPKDTANLSRVAYLRSRWRIRQ